MANKGNPYLRRPWKVARRSKVNRSPLCELCEKKGIIRVADVVHHINQDPWDNDPRNLMSLCRDCHETIHGRRGLAGCDPDGYPVDVNHPWNKSGR